MTRGSRDRDAAFISELRGTRTMFDAVHARHDGRMNSSRMRSGPLGLEMPR